MMYLILHTLDLPYTAQYSTYPTLLYIQCQNIKFMCFKLWAKFVYKLESQPSIFNLDEDVIILISVGIKSSIAHSYTMRG